MVRLGKIPIAQKGKGFITHADIEQKALEFLTVADSDTHTYVIVKCPVLQPMVDWAQRVGAEQLDKATFVSEVTPLLKDTYECEFGVVHDASALKSAYLTKVNNFINN